VHYIVFQDIMEIFQQIYGNEKEAWQRKDMDLNMMQ
jgi:hypothetical protein